MEIRKAGYYAYFVVFCPLFFFVSYYIIFPAFSEGDMGNYALFYENISNKKHGWESLFFLSKKTIGSSEIGYAIVAKMFSATGLSKLHFSSSLNFIFMASIGALSYKKNINIIYILAIVFSSIYFLMLLTELERLKLSIALLILALSYSNKLIVFLIFFISAALVHSQVALLSAPLFIVYFKHDIFNLLSRWRFTPIFLFLSLSLFTISIFLVSYMSDHLANKFYYYHTSFFFGDFAKSFLFSIIVLFFLKYNKFDYSIFSFYLCSLIIFLSSGRLNIMLYFISIYYLILYGRGCSKFLLFFIILFWGWKGVALFPGAFEHGAWWSVIE